MNPHLIADPDVFSRAYSGLDKQQIRIPLVISKNGCVPLRAANFGLNPERAKAPAFFTEKIYPLSLVFGERDEVPGGFPENTCNFPVNSKAMSIMVPPQASDCVCSLLNKVLHSGAKNDLEYLYEALDSLYQICGINFLLLKDRCSSGLTYLQDCGTTKSGNCFFSALRLAGFSYFKILVISRAWAISRPA